MVPGEGPVPCKWLILGEAPGANEAANGRPFCGRSGLLLDEGLLSAGVVRESVYITNAYKLRPPNNRTPTKAELAKHKEFLRAEFDAVQPLECLALGAIALGTLVPDAPGVSRCRGTWLLDQDWCYRVMPTWHPAYVLRNANEKENFLDDVRTFFGT